MTRLAERLAAEIAADGPVTVADYMARCLWDPADGYYATRPKLGADGDFLTAPIVSQMFGELLGLWAAAVWDQLGRPSSCRLVEVGPGDGALILPALRAAARVPGFLRAAELVLVEHSAPLRAGLTERLVGAPTPVRWVADVTELTPDRPIILIANEVLDCLPARQFVRAPRGWAERRVGLDDSGALAFALAPAPVGFRPPCDAETGQVVETSPAQQGFAVTVGTLVAHAGGAALLIDYGRDRPEPGDTLQALRKHTRVDPLSRPGACDLTVWADFPGVVAAARDAGAQTAGPVEQGAFLLSLGVAERAAALIRHNGSARELIERQLDRLVSPGHMGVLFKAVCLYKWGQPQPPGFDEPA